MTEPGHTDHEKVLVIVPTYNERETIGPILQRLRAANPTVSVLIVDDGSPDGTGDLADSIAKEDTLMHVMHRTEKDGLGAAYLAGFAWGLERDYDVIVEMDADGSHPPEDLPKLIAATGNADLVIGSRYVPGGKTVNWPLSRQFISRGGNTYCKVVLGVKIKDITAGFRAYRAAVLRSLPLHEVSSHGYCFQIDLAWRTLQAGYTVTEVPITFTERELGQSKMGGDVVREAVINVARWGLRHRARHIRGLFGRHRADHSRTRPADNHATSRADRSNTR